MRISDAAAAAGTTPRALRFYEQRGLLPPPSRTSGGQRRYGPREVARVRTIRRLLAVGLTIEDLRHCAHLLHLLEADDPTGGGCRQGSGIAQRRLDALNSEITRLTHLRDALAAQMNLTGQNTSNSPTQTPRNSRAAETEPRPPQPAEHSDNLLRAAPRA
ncbi:DNA-binding transcriptional MerR regulator [Actinomadura pelletieri DSM 43383]|uniref:DNA-binding transcriptional MerR regulator n=1 Tax=Actinomadura pelletieri DSM 43383 TaxID=1120940 RepID=A0A495QXF9_9ACTN|nr:MerR family transcriptional regulator [Actinomadura pelletieri]RKS78714.1 DNA-binding transcriptional MerR regulator [Actinomadura pelletieri DSM 43383]